MLGVPAATATTLVLLFGGGVAAVAVLCVLLRGRLGRVDGVGRVVAAALLLSLTALPWIGWRFAEDVHTTTGLDSYERANMGPIQAYLPGYLVNGARARIPTGATWAAAVGPSRANPVARGAFPSLVMITLFPRSSASIDRADWVVAWGEEPSTVARVTDVHVVHPRQGPLPPVVVGRGSR
jgi:hypothetical protein